MIVPHIEISIDEGKSDLTFRHVKQSRKEPLQIDVGLATLAEQGFDDAVRGIGTVVLRVLAKWHPETFAKSAGLHEPCRVDEDIALIESLIEKSFSRKTKAHLASINILVNELLAAAPEFSDVDTLAAWECAQQAIARYQD